MFYKKLIKKRKSNPFPFGKHWKRMYKKCENVWKETGKELFLVLSGVTIFSLILEMCRELRSFRVRRYALKLPYDTETGEKIKLVFLSDLHGREYGKENCELVAAIRKEKPDYILSGGDILTRGCLDSDFAAIRLFEAIEDLCPIYVANGNHEQGLKEYPDSYDDRYERYKKRLKKAGMIFLENETEEVDMKGIPVALTGLEIPIKCYSHFKTIPLKESEITERIGTASAERFQILLAHNPAFMKEYAAWGSKLTFSGHLHGGLVRIPGIGGVITPQAKLFPKYSGDMYLDKNKACIVSRGLGTHTINIRLFNTPEVVVVTLIPGNHDAKK